MKKYIIILMLLLACSHSTDNTESGCHKCLGNNSCYATKVSNMRTAGQITASFIADELISFTENLEYNKELYKQGFCVPEKLEFTFGIP